MATLEDNENTALSGSVYSGSYFAQFNAPRNFADKS